MILHDGSWQVVLIAESKSHRRLYDKPGHRSDRGCVDYPEGKDVRQSLAELAHRISSSEVLLQRDSNMTARGVLCAAALFLAVASAADAGSRRLQQAVEPGTGAYFSREQRLSSLQLFPLTSRLPSAARDNVVLAFSCGEDEARLQSRRSSFQGHRSAARKR